MYIGHWTLDMGHMGTWPVQIWPMYNGCSKHCATCCCCFKNIAHPNVGQCEQSAVGHFPGHQRQTPDNSYFAKILTIHFQHQLKWLWWENVMFQTSAQNNVQPWWLVAFSLISLRAGSFSVPLSICLQKSPRIGILFYTWPEMRWKILFNVRTHW